MRIGRRLSSRSTSLTPSYAVEQSLAHDRCLPLIQVHAPRGRQPHHGSVKINKTEIGYYVKVRPGGFVAGYLAKLCNHLVKDFISVSGLRHHEENGSEGGQGTGRSHPGAATRNALVSACRP